MIEFDCTTRVVVQLLKQSYQCCGLPPGPRCLVFHKTNPPVRIERATQARFTPFVGCRWRIYEEYLKPLLLALAIGQSATN